MIPKDNKYYITTSSGSHLNNGDFSPSHIKDLFQRLGNHGTGLLVITESWILDLYLICRLRTFSPR